MQLGRGLVFTIPDSAAAPEARDYPSWRRESLSVFCGSNCPHVPHGSAAVT